MAINETTAPPAETPTRTILAAQFDDRVGMWVRAMFLGVVDTGKVSPFGKLYRAALLGWRYFVKVQDVGLIVSMQKFALRLIVKEALVDLGVSKTDAEVSAAVDAMVVRGITFDHARTQAWEDLEARRRAGEVMVVEVEVADGAEHMTAHGIPF